jgi:putative Mg2+ transporter-C (MgtC) family protein
LPFHSLLAAIPSLEWPHVLLRLSVAAALGGAIGMERELRERQAGLRTHLVVCVGSALFTLVSAYGFHEFLVNGGSLVRTDPTRIAAQIVSGIGFLGAGAIIRQGLSVRGLTTAATLWLVAAIGMAAGAGYYSAALIATFGALLTLGPLRIVAYRVIHRYRPEVERLLVEIPAGGSPGAVIEAVERRGGRVVALEIAQEGDRRSIAADIELRGIDATQVVADVGEIDGVLEVRWTE